MNGNTIRTFLGANSSQGFYSLYAPFTEGYKTLVIKGGPGSGKSGLMKKIAGQAIRNGLFTEYCYCSSDADSVDGVRIAEIGLCIVDGTPPHQTEPKFPGAQDEILYTGQFWDTQKLQPYLPEIKELSEEISQCFRRAYRYLSAAGSASQDIRSSAGRIAKTGEMKAFARDITLRNVKKKSGTGSVLPRFLSGITPQGLRIHRDTVYTLAEKVFVLEDPWRIGSVFLDEVIETALKQGQTIYVFYDPLCPTVPEHAVLPEAGIGFVTANKVHGFEPQNAYRIHLSRFCEPAAGLKDQWKGAEKLIGSCLKEALNFLQKEKAYHDDLEEYYVNAMDFRKMNAFSAKLIRKLFE